MRPLNTKSTKSLTKSTKGFVFPSGSFAPFVVKLPRASEGRPDRRGLKDRAGLRKETPSGSFVPFVVNSPRVGRKGLVTSNVFEMRV
jgi:hypothetical protein